MHLTMRKRVVPFCLTILCAALIAGCSDSTAQGTLQTIASVEGATLYRTWTPSGTGHIRVITLRGSFREMGRQYGTLLRTDLATFYQDIIVGYLIGEKELSSESLLADAEAMYALAPGEVKELMQGVAETSGLTLPQLQIINSSMLVAIAQCSAVAAWGAHTGGGPLVLGRNWDMAAGTLDRFKEFMMVVVYNPPTGNSLADINYMGQFQFLQSALNDKGLWIDLQDGHMSSAAKDDTKRDPNGAMFEFLRNDSTMEELDASFMAAPTNTSLVMTVADPNAARAFFWCTQGTQRFTEDDQAGLLATSNHFVTWPESWTVDPLPEDPAAQGYTELRRNNWLSLANSPTYDGQLNDVTMMVMLQTTIPDGGGSFPTSGYDVETVYQIVVVPQDLLLFIRMPKSFGWEMIDLRGLFD